MAEAPLEAVVRVKLDTGDARSEAEKLQNDLAKEERDGEKRKETAKKKTRVARAEKRSGVLAGAALTRAAKFAGVALTISALLELVEFGAPAINRAIFSSIEKFLAETNLDKMPGVKRALETERQRVMDLSDRVSDLRSAITAGLATAKGTGDAAKTVALLSGTDMNTEQAWEFAKRLYEVTQALERSNRQQKKLSKEVIAETFGRLVSGGSN